MRVVLRWLQRIGLGLVGLIVVGLVVGAGYEQYMRHRATRRYPPMGKLVDVGGGRRIQIDCRGTGSPTVVLDHGADVLGSLAWTAVHDSIAATTRTCAYSRAGIVWSDPDNSPFDARGVARDLHAALTGAGEHPPYVMVGHSLGGPYVMIFTSLYQSEVAGVVFVDASHPDQFDRFRRALGSKAALAPPKLLYETLAALSWTGIGRFLPTGSEGPPIVNQISSAYISTSLPALVREALALDTITRVAGQFRDLGDRPLVVLTGAKPYTAEELKANGMTPDQGRQLATIWRQLHDDEATWSRKSRHEIVPDASHYIQFDRPDVVIRAVREVVAATAK